MRAEEDRPQIPSGGPGKRINSAAPLAEIAETLHNKVALLKDVVCQHETCRTMS